MAAIRRKDCGLNGTEEVKRHEGWLVAHAPRPAFPISRAAGHADAGFPRSVSAPMPRQARLEIPGIPLHITQRGVNRCAIFWMETIVAIPFACLAKARSDSLPHIG